MQVGIIGLPNVGKSTIFNVITKANAEVANYPFCTIEPNTGVISVVDDYLEQLSEICGSKKMTYASIQFMDVAGLVKGASKGEGLGNKFLSHIRAADIVAHVVRCFTDTNIASESPPDPVGDIATVNTELLLSDLEVLNRQKEKLKSLARTGDKEAGRLLEFTQGLIAKLNREERPDLSNLGQSQSSFLNQLDLLSLKPVLFVANMDDSQESKKLYRELAEQVGEQNTVQFYAQLEQELAEMEASERKQYIQELGIEGGPRPLVASC
ncbi:MAG: GTPase [Actinomycetota bacterium]|nr:GTPase [Actinomycetota bacterium]